MNAYTMIAIDPGNNLGVSIFKVDNSTHDILNIESNLIVLDSLIDNNTVDKMNDRLLVLQKVVKHLSDKYNPSVLAIEASFANMRFPKAVVQLSQYIAMIENGFISNNRFLKVFKYPPKLIKKTVGAGGNADKQDMFNCLSNHYELKCFLNNNDSEHEVDSIAIGYTAIRYIRNDPMVLSLI